MTAVVMIILAAVAAAWVLGPLRIPAAPGGSPGRPSTDGDPDREKAGGDPPGGTMGPAPDGAR